MGVQSGGMMCKRPFQLLPSIGALLFSLFWAGLNTNGTHAQMVPPVNCQTMSSPLIAFDVSKGQDPVDAIDFLDEMAANGYSVAAVNLNNHDSIDDIPTCIDILIIHGLASNNELSTPYDTVEASLIKSWVNQGHSLMLSGDWGNFIPGTQALFNTFGYQLFGGVVRDETDHDPGGPVIDPYAWVEYQSDNFSNHPILANIASLQLQASAWLDPANDVLVTTDSDANPATVPVMAAFLWGNGCVFMSTDSNWYATDGGLGGYDDEDNAKVARQAIGWLDGCESVLTAVAGGPYLVSEGAAIQLDGSGSYDPDSLPLTYSWDLDNDGAYDDATGKTATFSAVLLDDGSYPIGLQISNGSQTATHSTTVVVQNVPPAASLHANKGVIPVGESISFTASFTDPGTLDTHNWVWHFGDGTPPSTSSLTADHQFNTAGSHLVTFTVTDDDGGEGQATQTIEVIQTIHKIYLPTVFKQYCTLEQTPPDIVFAIDASYSMGKPIGSSTTTKLAAAQAETTAFINAIQFEHGAQVGLVTFNDQAVLDHPLSQDAASLVTAVHAINLALETRIDRGLNVATNELGSIRHAPANDKVIILLSDGQQTAVPETAVLDAANAAKNNNIHIYTISLGNKPNSPLMSAIASDPASYFHSAGNSTLSAVYDEIFNALLCGVK